MGTGTVLRNDFVKEIAEALRPQDLRYGLGEIFYAGETAVKDISALMTLINDIKALGKNAFFAEDRNAISWIRFVPIYPAILCYF